MLFCCSCVILFRLLLFLTLAGIVIVVCCFWPKNDSPTIQLTDRESARMGARASFNICLTFNLAFYSLDVSFFKRNGIVREWEAKSFVCLLAHKNQFAFFVHLCRPPWQLFNTVESLGSSAKNCLHNSQLSYLPSFPPSLPPTFYILSPFFFEFSAPSCFDSLPGEALFLLLPPLTLVNSVFGRPSFGTPVCMNASEGVCVRILGWL